MSYDDGGRNEREYVSTSEALREGEKVRLNSQNRCD